MPALILIIVYVTLGTAAALKNPFIPGTGPGLNGFQ
jgi:hypothetical protein